MVPVVILSDVTDIMARVNECTSPEKLYTLHSILLTDIIKTLLLQ